MSGLALNFKRGKDRTEDQKLRLGVVETVDNHTWSYVQFRESVAIGDVVVDGGATLALSSGSNTSNAGIASLTEDTEAGEFEITVADGFSSAVDKYLVGAIGYIHAGAGLGVSFYVEEVVDDDIIRVVFISDGDGYVAPGSGLSDNLDTSTRFTLYAPGLVSKGDDVSHVARGVAQAPAAAGEYGWVLQKGWGLVDIDAGGAALAYGSGLKPSSTGQLEGFASTPTTTELLRGVGLVPFTDLTAATDALMLVNLNIDNTALSFVSPDVEHAFNRVDI